MSLQPSDLPTLRQFSSGAEQVYHLRDGKAYRVLCEHFFKEGYDFPQCLSGIDMEFGLRSVLHLRRLRDHAEVTLWLDVPYDKPRVPSVTDLWGGLEWHEREAFDLLGIHYDGHPDHRRILLEDHWTIHPLQRRYDTGGYLIPEWQPKAWPDWEALDREAQEAERKRQEAERAKAEAAKAQAAPASAEGAGDLTQIRALNANYAAKLKEQGITTLQALAALTDEALEPLATAVGLKSPAAVTKWRDGARELVAAAKVPEAAPAAGDDLTQIKALNANYAAKLREQGITHPRMLADLSDDTADELAAKVGLKSAAAVKKWREGARALLAESTTAAEVFDVPSPERVVSSEAGEQPDPQGRDQGRDIAEIKTLNAKFAGLLKEQGITTVAALAALPDERLDEIATAVGLKSSAAVKKWREGAQALLRGES